METVRVSLLLRIPELSKSHVIMPDPAGVCDKLRKMSQDGKDTIQTVFDFDQTLTKAFVDGEKIFNSFDVILNAPDMPEQIKTEIEKSLKSIFKVAADTELTNEEKTPLLEESYKELKETLQTGQMPFSDKADIEQVVMKSNIVLRDRVDETFKSLHDCSIPVTILSAGLIYSIDTILNAKGLQYSNVLIKSNSFQFENKKIVGFLGETVGVLDKNNFFLKIRSKEIEKRQNIILVGDYTTDATMVDGVPDSANVLRIAFYNNDENDSAFLDEFKKVFDIVICNDDSVDVLNAILSYVTNSSS